MPRPISATISLSSLRHNLDHLAQRLAFGGASSARQPPRIWAVIKADAYGHGIDNAVRAFAGADGLAMLDLNEAIRCREAGWDKPILLLEGFFEPADLDVLDQYRLTTALHSQEQLDMLAAFRPRAPLDAFVKLNSGMNRLGFAPGEYRDAYEQARRAQQQGILGLVGKMTHFARADDDAAVTRKQLDTFADATRNLPGPVSVCNSAAALTPELWTLCEPQEEQWVRPGICLYGSSPFARQTAAQLGLMPAMTLAARLISVRTIGPGEAIGYGHLFASSQNMRIGVVSCGYADGYPRHAGTGTPITVAGVRTRILGRVSMDMLVADLTPVPDAHIGAPVVLWGAGGPSVDEVAEAAGTIGYELLCAVAPRVQKIITE
jgi:alanine racemase